jgi:SAM-dependent methyltransferase
MSSPDASTASLYENYHESRFRYDARRDRIWREVCRYLQTKYVVKSSCVLELGAGYCHFINNICASQKHALDIFPRLKEYASPDVVCRIGTCTDLSSYADSSFDVVFASNLFEHLDRAELEKTAGEVRRVLTVGGRLILLQPNFRYAFREYFDDYTHKFVFTDLSLADFLVNEGYSIDDVQPKFLPFSMKSKAPKFPWLVRLYLASPYRPLAGQMLVVASRQSC